MDRGTAETIVKVYGILALIAAALWGLSGMFILFSGALSMHNTMMGLDPGFFGSGYLLSFFGILFLLGAVLSLVTGIGLLHRKGWARFAAIICSALALSSFPLGTVIGAFGIWFFGFEETTKEIFSGTPARTRTVVKKKKQ